MFRTTFLILAILLISSASFAQQKGIIFNKTEHDFGHIAPSSIPFEQDFLFRNTTDQRVTILTVRSVSPALSFIHTRSEILPTEYGFVKVKLKSQGIKGLFHDEVYVTFRVGNDVKSEVIYLRAQISTNGKSDNERAFNDSEIAVSVEVSPEDIETMEGFTGDDRLTQAEAEIKFLKKQVSMKSELIAKLSSDIKEKQTQEAENIERLSNIENSLQSSNAGLNPEVLKQISQLGKRLNELQESGDRIQGEIAKQESEYERLRHESDSARQHAQLLSKQLSQQFKAQADAMNLANRLAQDLKKKEQQEKRQQAQIDSLENRIAMGGGVNTSQEIQKLKRILAIKIKEQNLNEEHANFQKEKIERLNESKELLALKSDSLERNLANRSRENSVLKTKLKQSTSRINRYEQKIDSLSRVSNIESSDPSQMAELDKLRKQLADLENRDKEHKQSVQSKDNEIASLEAQKSLTEKNLKALEAATNRQLDETHELMYRVSKLKENEEEAQSEISHLQGELESSKYRENVARTSVKTLKRDIETKEKSIKQFSDSLASQENELAHLHKEHDALESQLENAKMSNQFAFEEMKLEAHKMQGQKDSLLAYNRKLVSDNKCISNEIEILQGQKMHAELVVEELTNGSKANIHFEVSAIRSKNQLKTIPNNLGSKISIYTNNSGYEYTVGQYKSMKAAINKAEEIKELGYNRSHVIAFKNGERVSVKQALDTAELK